MADDRRHVALRLAYDGTRFSGSQRQPDVRTVEGALLRALEAVRADATDFRCASRTDRGVSAIANVVSIRTAFPPEGLCGALNAHMADAWCHAWAMVDEGFRPRYAATRRAYRYFLLREHDMDVERVSAAFACFRGEHDFTAFSRRDPGRAPRRRVDVATVHAAGDMLVFDVEGPSFLWNQVRRMVAAARAHGLGHVDLDVIRRALDDGFGPDLGVVAPEGLVLMDVDAPVTWHRADGAVRRTVLALAARRRELARHGRVLGELEEGVVRPLREPGGD